MTATSIAFIRNVCFSLLGLVLLSYAIAVLFTGQPDPVASYIPGLAGIIVAIIVTVISRSGHAKAAAIAWDELTRKEWSHALVAGYWVAIGLYPIFGVLLYLEMVVFSQSFAAMGTLSGAAPFLVFSRSWLKGRI
jgi:uncharacterized membrane protein YkvI